MPIFPSNDTKWYPERTIVDLQRKPAKAKPYVTAYKKNGFRVSDHRLDYPSATWMRNSYAKRQSFNCNSTYLFLNSSDGFWHLYDATSGAYIKRLNGPAGDNAEMQWDKLDPHVLYYGEVNGGTRIHKLDVSTNINSVQYDFTTAIRALFPTAVHCWSGSEGSPTADGTKWGFKAEDTNFVCLGYFVMDIFAQQIVWHMAETTGARPDFVTITPSGRYFITSDFPGTFAYPLDGSPRKTLHHTVEHADSVLLANGHDGWVTIDYQSDNGDMFYVDIDDPLLTKNVFDTAYHNVFYGTNYAWHFSGRALNKPGYVVCSNVGTPPCQMYIVELATGRKFVFGCNYAVRNDYFDEAHAVPNANLTKVMHNDNYGTSLDIDAYVVLIPKLV